MKSCDIRSVEMSNETKIRVINAFRAMKAIGINQDKVKPILKALLTLYDKNWAPIEEGNYRALADAILERDEKGVSIAGCTCQCLLIFCKFS